MHCCTLGIFVIIIHKTTKWCGSRVPAFVALSSIFCFVTTRLFWNSAEKNWIISLVEKGWLYLLYSFMTSEITSAEHCWMLMKCSGLPSVKLISSPFVFKEMEAFFFQGRLIIPVHRLGFVWQPKNKWSLTEAREWPCFLLCNHFQYCLYRRFKS